MLIYVDDVAGQCVPKAQLQLGWNKKQFFHVFLRCYKARLGWVRFALNTSPTRAGRGGGRRGGRSWGQCNFLFLRIERGIRAQKNQIALAAGAWKAGGERSNRYLLEIRWRKSATKRNSPSSPWLKLYCSNIFSIISSKFHLTPPLIMQMASVYIGDKDCQKTFSLTLCLGN